ncbi:MAG: hypothetical protein ACE366_07065 [Bradymonadia bacterium]
MVRPGLDRRRPGIVEHQDLLSLIDGQRSLAQLCEHSGLSAEDLVRRLTTLLRAGVIQVRQNTSAQSGNPKSDAYILHQAGWIGRVPPEPAISAGHDIRAGWQPMSTELDPSCDLPETLQTEVLFLLGNLASIDHFELFGIEPTDERRLIKRGFFSFSKRFHPDRHYGKDLGSFKDLLQQLFEYGSAVHDTLLKHETLRGAYARTVASRNARNGSDVAPESPAAPVADEAVRQAPSTNTVRPAADTTRPAPARAPRGPSDSVDRKARLKEIAARRRMQREEGERAGPRTPEQKAHRKSDLEARLKARKQTRRVRQSGLPAQLKARLSQAEEYYQEAMKHILAERPVQGASLLRMALSLDPKNVAFQRALDEVDGRARSVAAAKYWSEGKQYEKGGQVEQAWLAYREAIRLSPEPARMSHVTEFAMNEVEDIREIIEVTTLWVSACPHDPDAHMAQARAYERAGLYKKATLTLESLLEHQPNHKEAKRYLRGLRRKS